MYALDGSSKTIAPGRYWQDHTVNRVKPPVDQPKPSFMNAAPRYDAVVYPKTDEAYAGAATRRPWAPVPFSAEAVNRRHEMQRKVEGMSSCDSTSSPGAITPAPRPIATARMSAPPTPELRSDTNTRSVSSTPEAHSTVRPVFRQTSVRAEDMQWRRFPELPIVTVTLPGVLADSVLYDMRACKAHTGFQGPFWWDDFHEGHLQEYEEAYAVFLQQQVAAVGVTSTPHLTDQIPSQDQEPGVTDLISYVGDDTASIGTQSDCFVSLPDSGEWPFLHQSTHAETSVSAPEGLHWHPGQSKVLTIPVYCPDVLRETPATANSDHPMPIDCNVCGKSGHGSVDCPKLRRDAMLKTQKTAVIDLQLRSIEDSKSAGKADQEAAGPLLSDEFCAMLLQSLSHKSMIWEKSKLGLDTSPVGKLHPIALTISDYVCQTDCDAVCEQLSGFEQQQHPVAAALHSAPVAASRPTTSTPASVPASIPASEDGTVTHEVAAAISCYGTPALQESETQNPPGRSSATFDYACTDSDQLSLLGIQARLAPGSQVRIVKDNVYAIGSKRERNMQRLLVFLQLYDQAWPQLSMHAVTTRRSLVCARQLAPIASSSSLRNMPVALQSPESYMGNQLLEDLPLFQAQTTCWDPGHCPVRSDKDRSIS